MAAKETIAFEPIGDRVVVRRHKAKDTTEGGIALPDCAKENPRRGIVIAAGPGALRPMATAEAPLFALKPKTTQPLDIYAFDRFPMQCKVGDEVLLPYSGECIMLDPDDKASEIIVVQESQLLAILRKA